jgi:hypothetical protein
MTPAKQDRESTLGISAATWSRVIDRVGIPGAFMLFICYLLWLYVPPIVTGHLDLLRENVDSNREGVKTLNKMEAEQSRQNMMLEKMCEGKYPDLDWRDETRTEHKVMKEVLQRIEEHTKRIP